MNIILNGEPSDIADGSHIDDLISSLGLQPERVAVELNHVIVRRVNWSTTSLSHGDHVEIVHFVGGGSNIDGRS